MEDAEPAGLTLLDIEKALMDIALRNPGLRLVTVDLCTGEVTTIPRDDSTSPTANQGTDERRQPPGTVK